MIPHVISFRLELEMFNVDIFKPKRVWFFLFKNLYLISCLLFRRKLITIEDLIIVNNLLDL